MLVHFQVPLLRGVGSHILGCIITAEKHQDQELRQSTCAQLPVARVEQVILGQWTSLALFDSAVSNKRKIQATQVSSNICLRKEL